MAGDLFIEYDAVKYFGLAYTTVHSTEHYYTNISVSRVVLEHRCLLLSLYSVLAFIIPLNVESSIDVNDV